MEAEKSYCYLLFTELQRCPGHIQHQSEQYPCSYLLHLQSRNAPASTYSALQETSSPVPGQSDQLRRAAVTPFLAATWLTPSVLGIYTKVSEGLRTAAANPTLLLQTAVRSSLRG